MFTRDVFGIHGIRSKFLIHSFNTKSKQDTKEIQIHPNLLTYLEAYDLNLRKEFLFHGQHGLEYIHRASADKILREACFKIDLEGVSTHSFRRTALTHMSDAGVPLRHIQEISGHRTLAALERYQGVTDE
ncbi:MAG: tyrosine-type recombinase/integrase [Coleofasciculaceae cyanobacterium]